MAPKDIFQATILVLIWGFNFVVIKVGLRDIPPLLLGACRFALVAVPAVFFIPRPRIPLPRLLAYALTISFGQFAFLFSAIHAGMPTGLASLVLQVQAFITLALSSFVFGDRLKSHNFLGLAVAFGGLALLANVSIGSAGVPLTGFLLTLCAASSWAMGNVVNKTIGQTDLIGLVVWSALVPIAPFLLASAVIEGPDAIAGGLGHLTILSILSVAYLAVLATQVGYTLWGSLLARHPAWKVAPLTLLVPVVGMTSAWAVLGEALTTAQILGALVILCGLLINVFGARLRAVG
jgi:O-acetylserine/cysteine efflux transporter